MKRLRDNNDGTDSMPEHVYACLRRHQIERQQLAAEHRRLVRTNDPADDIHRACLHEAYRLVRCWEDAILSEWSTP